MTRESPAHVFDYLDYRLYLKDQLKYLQSVDRKFSQRWVARRAGFKAPQLLSMILQGQRNLSRDKVPELAAAFKLTPREQEYFSIIVELDSCEGRQAQNMLLSRIQTGFRDGLFVAIDEGAGEIFKDWYYPALREIVTLKHARPQAEWMAEQLGISPVAAKEALDLLLEKGFLRWNAEHRLERADPSISTQGRIFPMLLGSWHMKMLEKAFQAIRLPREKRHFEGLTFAVPRQLMPQLKEMVQRFLREVDTLAESQEQREEVCHLHIELFPLTRWLDESSPHATPTK